MRKSPVTSGLSVDYSVILHNIGGSFRFSHVNLQSGEAKGENRNLFDKSVNIGIVVA